MKSSESESESETDSLTAQDKWRLLEQWECLREGNASAEEVAEINARLKADAAARNWLAQAVLLEAELRYDGESLFQEGAAAKLTASAMPPARRWMSLRWSHAAAALLAAALSWGIWAGTQPSDTSVATLVKAQSCKWGNSALPTLEGSALVPGTLELVEGMATLRFKSGAEVVMEAPVSLEVVSAMEARVHRGTIVAEVPPEAKGFTIQTPETTVVDFGTKFGVSAGDDGKCLVHVLEGLVEVNRKGEDKVTSLRGGERLDYGGLTQAMINPDADKQQAEPGRWLPAAAMADLGDGWQVITTAFGRGKDSWIQSSPKHVITGKETYLRVKHTTLDEKLERKIYLAFDLSKRNGPIAEAELVLNLEPSDLGYGSLVPDATFVVYGLIDESEDAWSEDALHWTNAPAHSLATEHHAVPDASKVVALGRFEVAQGRQVGTVSLKSAAMADFLRGDSNDLVTLIVCRETDETARNGLVHAFASKENGRNSPPMLRLRVER
jgi:hypothetical protein